MEVMALHKQAKKSPTKAALDAQPDYPCHAAMAQIAGYCRSCGRQVGGFASPS